MSISCGIQVRIEPKMWLNFHRDGISGASGRGEAKE